MLRDSSRFATLMLALYVLFTFVGAALAFAQVKASPVAPDRARVEAAVREAYEKFRSDTSGKNADYIPYLAQVDSKLFGIAVVTTDNQVFELGDAKYSFSIQSISKVYTLALAMDELGYDKVFQRIGSEPTLQSTIFRRTPLSTITPSPMPTLLWPTDRLPRSSKLGSTP